MLEGFREKFMRWFTIVLVAGIAVGGLSIAYPEYRRRAKLLAEDAELKAQIEMKKREIAHLVDNQHRFHSDADFVESIARQNRRVYPGELVFIFDN